MFCLGSLFMKQNAYVAVGRSGNPLFLIPALWNMGILLHKQATQTKHFTSGVGKRFQVLKSMIGAPVLNTKRTWTTLLAICNMYNMRMYYACIIQRCKANLLNFCRSYDRGDFPMVLSHTSRGCKIVWKVGNCLYSCSKMHSKFSSEPFISPFLIP